MAIHPLDGNFLPFVGEHALSSAAEESDGAMGLQDLFDSMLRKSSRFIPPCRIGERLPNLLRRPCKSPLKCIAIEFDHSLVSGVGVSCRSLSYVYFHAVNQADSLGVAVRASWNANRSIRWMGSGEQVIVAQFKKRAPGLDRQELESFQLSECLWIFAGGGIATTGNAGDRAYITAWS